MKGSDIQKFMSSFNNGTFPNQRLGQAFVNQFGHEHCAGHHYGKITVTPDPCLFYQDGPKAAKTIWEMVKE